MEDKLVVFAEEIFASLGQGYSERVYHNAMELQLRDYNIYYETERTIEVKFKDRIVGHVRADLIVDKSIVVELKAVAKVRDDHITQCKMYMRLLGLSQGIIINFPEKGDSIEVVDVTTPSDSRASA
jgi:GxxExxY protein